MSRDLPPQQRGYSPMIRLHFETLRELRLAALLAGVAVAFAAGPAHARQVRLISNFSNNTVGEYDATTGATINATFINSSQGLNAPTSVVFLAPLPEPSSLLLVAAAAIGVGIRQRSRLAGRAGAGSAA